MIPEPDVSGKANSRAQCEQVETHSNRQTFASIQFNYHPSETFTLEADHQEREKFPAFYFLPLPFSVQRRQHRILLRA